MSSRIFDLGTCELHAQQDRQVTGDHGPTIEMFVRDGLLRLIFRGDCFEKTPHYHYGLVGPHGEGERYNMDRIIIGDDLVGWTFRHLQEHLPAILVHVGFPGTADVFPYETMARVFQEAREFLNETPVAV